MCEMCKEDKFDKDALTMLYNIGHLNPFKLLQDLEESHCYAVSNIEMRQRFIQDEMRHLWKDEKVCISASKKYIKQMKREIKVFEERAEVLSHFIQKIRNGEYTEEEEITDEMKKEGEQLCHDMLDTLKGENNAGSV